MDPSPTVHGTLTVSSGCICFGHLQEIWQGALNSPQPLQQVRPQVGGTIMRQPIQYNAAARNGIWNVYRLLNDRYGEGEDIVTAWFAAHRDIDPMQEADKILRVSGSPYEDDSGSQWNNASTFAEGVFAINRYDWLAFDEAEEVKKKIEDAIDPQGEKVKAEQRRKKELEDQEMMEAEEEIKLPYGISAWLVDRKEARKLVMKYYQQESPTKWPKGAAYLHLKNAEYEFARLGFDDTRETVRSFIFFSTNTVFTETRFEGITKTLRKYETPEEKFWRWIKEGYDFAGVEKLQLWTDPESGLGHPVHSPSPPPDQLLGPYDKKMHILTPDDIESLRIHDVNSAKIQPTPLLETVKPWDEPLIDLLNEVLMTHLQRNISPNIFDCTLAEAGELLFLRRESLEHRSPLEAECFTVFKNAQNKLPVRGFDSAAVGSRIEAFLQHIKHLRDYHENALFRRSLRLVARYETAVVIDPQTLISLTAVEKYLACEVLELASNAARDSEKMRMTPWDIRAVTLNDAELRRVFEYSKVFWQGR